MQKYLLISNDIRNKILEGRYRANERIPFEKDLCDMYQSSKMTVKRALDILVSEGLIVKRRGYGTFVKDLCLEEAERINLANQIRGRSALHPDKKVESEILNFAIVAAPREVQSRLNINEDHFVYDIYRIRLVEQKPIVMEHTYMPIDVIPALKRHHVKESIYDYIENTLHLTVQSAHRTVTVRKASDFEAQKLNLEIGDPVAVVNQIGYLHTGIAFEHSTSVHRYDEYSVQFILTKT